jgi:hypothetical protein
MESFAGVDNFPTLPHVDTSPVAKLLADEIDKEIKTQDKSVELEVKNPQNQKMLTPEEKITAVLEIMEHQIVIMLKQAENYRTLINTAKTTVKQKYYQTKLNVVSSEVESAVDFYERIKQRQLKDVESINSLGTE